MKIQVLRKYFKDDYTIGKLYLNGKYFCDTLEDKDRGLNQSMTSTEIADKKVYSKTAIPYGTYNVTMTMSNKFKRVLPLINNVKGFEGIRIHAGNTANDSLGCILVGENKEVGKVINSRKKENELVALLNKIGKEKIQLIVTK
ncbi:MAG: DUF5675 family protein [Bacteroidales bacterium]|nr:DUF5675 family protein [Bacteroidales bacterium]